MSGQYATINTNCLYNIRQGTPLSAVAAFCNSAIFMFFYEQFFGALRMSGGYYQFQSPQLRVMPFKQPSVETCRRLDELVEMILSSKKEDSAADTSAQEQEIDRLFYKTYDLDAEDIAKIVGRSPN